MTSSYDAIVVGGGHNGLVAAAYLARSGARTVVLEGRHKTGGAATTDQPWPDAPHLSVTRLSYVMSLMPPTVVEDLKLAQHGYRVHPMGPYFQAFPEGGSLTIYEDDEARTYDEMARWSKKDAEAWPRWNAWLAGIAGVMGPLLTRVPPTIGSHSPSDLADLGRLVWKNRGVDTRMVADITRLMSMSIADLLDDWFESPQVKGALAVNGVIGTWAGPYAPGTAYVMAHHSIGDVGDGAGHSQQLGSWGYPEGGMGAVSAAIERSARTFGVEVRTNARVQEVTTSNGRATGVTLENGDQLSAPVVVTTLHPKTAFLDQLARTALPEDFVRDIERWNTRSGVVKINLALSELPRFTDIPDTDRDTGHARGGVPEHLTGSVEMSPTMEFIERAFQDAREGRPALLPFSDGVIPTSLDKTLNPDGTHIFSLFTQYVPHEWSEAPHTEELEAYTDRLIDLYDQVAPGFAASVTHRDIVGPHQMQEEYGLIGGNIFHGELTPEQLFHMRPAPGYADYRTPIAGLYNASSATHGGGGVCGIPGWQAAKAAIHDKKSIRNRLRRRAR
jgi:phytoene dehydrogenase-like protein